MYPTHDQSLALEWKSDNGRTVAFWWILSVPRVFFKQAPFTFSSAFPAELSRFYEHLNGKQPPGQPFSHEQTVWSLLDYIYIHIYMCVCEQLVRTSQTFKSCQISDIELAASEAEKKKEQLIQIQHVETHQPNPSVEIYVMRSFVWFYIHLIIVNYTYIYVYIYRNYILYIRIPNLEWPRMVVVSKVQTLHHLTILTPRLSKGTVSPSLGLG
jgi:hypothetical protein